MQLDDFIASTLTQIVAGIRRAQEGVAQHGAIINPQVEGKSAGDLDPSTMTFRKNVEFDVAVTVAKTTGSGAGLKVAAFGMGGNLEGKSDQHHSAVSRIKFSVLCVFPKQLPREPDDPGYVPPIK
jgi:hypothetical protein